MTIQIPLFEELNKQLLYNEQPSEYFNQLIKKDLLNEYPLTMLSQMYETEQSAIHHPEGNVWNHTMLVIDGAALAKEKSKNARVFMWAALLHDIGKPDTTRKRKDRVTAYGHDKLGAKLSREFLEFYKCEKDFIDQVVALVRWHMQILFVVNDLPFAEIKTMKEQVDIDEIALLGLCDRLGRTGVDRALEEKNVELFRTKSINYQED